MELVVNVQKLKKFGKRSASGFQEYDRTKDAHNKKSKQIELELDLPDIEVLGLERGTDGSYEIWIASTKVGTECRKCGRVITKYHGKDRVVKIRHLPILGHACYLKIEPCRYICPACSGDDGVKRVTTTERLDWFNSKNSVSCAYEDKILLALVNSTVQDVSRKEGIGYGLVLGVLKERI